MNSICLVGYGYWGKNIFRNLIEMNLPYNLIVVEKCELKRKHLKSFFPKIYVSESIDNVLINNNVSAVIIATETSSHFSIAKKALELNKHVFIEKPITTSYIQAEELIQKAKKINKVLMVDHIFLYHPVVHKLKEYFLKSELGKINYIDSTRINLGIYQKDVNVLWDLACHDISIIDYLIEEKPNSVRAIGRMNPQYEVEDIAYLFLYYPSGMLVQINSSWSSPVKIRKMIIGGEKKMIIYDDIEPTNKLIIYDYDHKIVFDENKKSLSDYRLGNITIPKFEPIEALRIALEDFFTCIKEGKQPKSSGEKAMTVVNILEKAQQSLNLKGDIVPLY